ncbi:hypothetical protein MMC19_004308 [Ptychographa xylographoides]|nr:hypothetical protein [Ptychographa xylographoides]
MSIKVIFGTGGYSQFHADTILEIHELLQQHDVKDLDTASIYPGSEDAIGKSGAPKQFIIHTKAPGFSEGSLSKSSILAGMEKSLKELGVESVETYFLHCPDPSTPIEETVEAINQLYKEGKFKYFGLSNFTASDVDKIHSFASSKSYVLPTVYQGNYNPVSRSIETSLFPTLRRLNIAFYAYSPLAGGFLVRTTQELEDANQGRFDKSSFVGQMYHDMYNKPSLVAALKDWESAAEEAGTSKAALAYRWVAYNSILSKEHGDGIILGASKVGQLKQSLEALKEGPLSENVVKKIDEVWEKVKHEAPLDNYNR